MAKAVETPLEMAKRHVIEQQARIAKQENLIVRLRAAGVPTEAALELLGTMERLLAVFVEDYARLSPPKALR